MSVTTVWVIGAENWDDDRDYVIGVCTTPEAGLEWLKEDYSPGRHPEATWEAEPGADDVTITVRYQLPGGGRWIERFTLSPYEVHERRA